MKDFLHFMKHDKLWYYWLDTNETSKSWRTIENNKAKLLFENSCSKAKALSKLRELFPDKEPIYTLPYHEGPRMPGESGSRPQKGWTKKDYEKRAQKDKY